MDNSAKNVRIYHFQFFHKFTDNFLNIPNISRSSADSVFPIFPKSLRFNCNQKPYIHWKCPHCPHFTISQSDCKIFAYKLLVRQYIVILTKYPRPGGCLLPSTGAVHFCNTQRPLFGARFSPDEDLLWRAFKNSKEIKVS